MIDGIEAFFRKQDRRFGFLLLLVAFALPLIMAVVDLTQGVLPSDSSCFRWIGWRVACGDGCYSVAFDHKGPVIFLVHALGYWLTGANEYGVEIVYSLMWLYIIYSIFKLARKLSSVSWGGVAAVVFSLVALVCGAGLIDNIETTALFFGLAMLDVAGSLSPEARDLGCFRSFSCGLLAAIVFMTKANMVALPGAIGLIWISDAIDKNHRASAIKTIVMSFVGFLLGMAVLFSVFGWKDTWDAAFAFNMFEYRHNKTLLGFWIDYIKGFRSIWAAWFLAGWCGMMACGLVGVLFGGRWKLRHYRLLVVWLVVETAAAVGFSGFYEHYAIPSLAVTCVLFAATLFELGSRRAALLRWGLCLIGLLFCYVEAKWFVGIVLRRQATRKSVLEIREDLSKRFPGETRFAIWGGMEIDQWLCDVKVVKPPQKYFWQTSNYACGGLTRKSQITGELLSCLTKGKVAALLIEPSVGTGEKWLAKVSRDQDLVREVSTNWIEEKRPWGSLYVPRDHRVRVD